MSNILIKCEESYHVGIKLWHNSLLLSTPWKEFKRHIVQLVMNTYINYALARKQ